MPQLILTCDVTMAMKLACESGRLAFLSGRIPKRLYAKTSSPELEHFFDVFAKGKVDAALDASIFHYREISIQEVKEYLIKKGINIRINK